MLWASSTSPSSLSSYHLNINSVNKFIKIFIVKVLLTVLITGGLKSNTYAQVEEAEQLLLNWEKLNQFKDILNNMYQGYMILERGYRTIKDISEGNYTIHQAFFDGLAAVSPAVRNYKRIPYIIDYQKLLLKEYRSAYDRFRQDPNFKLEELEYLARVYSFLFEASLRNLDDLVTIITATKLSMTDYERMQAVDRIFYDMQNKLMFLNGFNNSTYMVAVQRAKSKNDVNTMKKLYGVD
jgi:hypothetical protein